MKAPARKEGTESRRLTAETRLARFTRYELRKDELGYPEIAPADDARLEWYRPFDFDPEMLVAYLETVRSVRGSDARTTTNISIVHDYLEQSLPTTARRRRALERVFEDARRRLSGTRRRVSREARDSGRAPLAAPPLLTPDLKQRLDDRIARDLRRILEFHSRFGLLDMDCESLLRDSYDLESRADSRGRRGVQEDFESYCRGFRTRLSSWYVSEDSIFDMALRWQEFRESGAAAGDERVPGQTWEETFAMEAVNIGLSVRFRGAWQIEFRVPNAWAALRVMLAQSLMGPKRSLGLCRLPDCRRPFIAEDPRQVFCDRSCSNRARQRTFQAAKRRRPGGRTTRPRP